MVVHHLARRLCSDLAMLYHVRNSALYVGSSPAHHIRNLLCDRLVHCTPRYRAVVRHYFACLAGGFRADGRGLAGDDGADIGHLARSLSASVQHASEAVDPLRHGPDTELIDEYSGEAATIVAEDVVLGPAPPLAELEKFMRKLDNVHICLAKVDTALVNMACLRAGRIAAYAVDAVGPLSAKCLDANVEGPSDCCAVVESQHLVGLNEILVQVVHVEKDRVHADRRAILRWEGPPLTVENLEVSLVLALVNLWRRQHDF
mmetsp:Transcript_8905/g.23116  ORF Transcript_8905/g.23116 Transcript_8905/m.23116 type:complete len:260 (+) Transcript_8905:737-1516(+)